MKYNLLIFLCLITISSFSQKNFNKGYYYDNENNRIECLIRIDVGATAGLAARPTSIKVMTNNSKKKKSLKIDEIKSFVVDQDSFAIISNINVSMLHKPFKKDFAKVIETGKINLYIHRFMATFGTANAPQKIWEYYVINKNGTDEYILLNDDFKIDKEKLSKMVKDDKELFNYLSNLDKEEWKQEIIKEVVIKYNAKHD